MATYKGIQGYSVQTLASDPTAANTEGQLWFNSTTSTYKIAAAAAGAWSSGNLLNTAREHPGGAGVSQSSAIAFGGLVPPSGSPRYQDSTEIYNGTTWSETGALTTGRSTVQGAGTTTAALAFGGYNTPLPSYNTLSETFDGEAWTATNPLTTARVNSAGYGTSTAANAVDGETYINTYEQYNGTSWTASTANNTARQGLRGCGTTTAGLIFGGNDNPATPTVNTGKTEIWNGTSWTEVNPLTSARVNSSGAGATTAAMCAGGAPAPPTFGAITELYNGTSWTEVGDLATGRVWLGSASSSPNSNSVVFGGYTPALPAGIAALTEEWNGAPVTVKTVTTS